MDNFSEKERDSSKDEENRMNRKRVGNMKFNKRQVSKGKTAVAEKRTIKKETWWTNMQNQSIGIQSLGRFFGQTTRPVEERKRLQHRSR